MVGAVDDQLRPRPRLQQIAFKLLLVGLGWMALLPAAWQVRLLQLLEGFPIRLVRVGIWGLKTLIYLGYYGQADVQRRIRTGRRSSRATSSCTRVDCPGMRETWTPSSTS